MNQDALLALDKIPSPELIFGLVAPIGVNLDSVTESLKNNLRRVGYDGIELRLTSEMTQFQVPVELEDEGLFNYYDSRIRYANAVRARTNRNDTLGLLAIAAIRKERQLLTGNPDEPRERQAYIIRQLKHPSEIELLRRVYGKQFITICAYQPEQARINNLIKKAKADKYKAYDESIVKSDAKKLVDRDYAELKVSHGQRVRDAFPKGDVFIDAATTSTVDSTMKRFIDALFGRNSVSPTIEEYGMYLAKTASLRSLDLSRQVGAAILTSLGEIIALGSNEVPKFKGGTYWDPETEGRDYFQGFDPNEAGKTRVLLDILDKLKERKVLSERLSNVNTEMLLRQLTDKESQYYVGDVKVLDIIEFGRIIHAEMSALCDCARLGRSVNGAHLYCTTFPCHICAKHIVAAGITKVVFLEPYPKSHAIELHADSISIDEASADRVWFKPFIGIAPHRYQDLFEKGKRKDGAGKGQEWYEREPRPRMSINTVRPYIENEKMLQSGLLALVENSVKPER
jgi:deoxycytidylate deaminase